MTAAALTQVRLRSARYWLPFAAVSVTALCAMGLLFRAEAAAAVQVWLRSTAYGHCFLVLPIALWLAWDRRQGARGLAPVPTAWPALAMLPFAAAWFAAERLGLMEGRQLAAIGMTEAVLIALLGWRLARVFAAALLYLVFLVPFGSFLVPALQSATAWFVDVGLGVLGVPHVVDAFVIEVPDATFFVAEACAGLRFLIAAVAFGALYGLVVYRGPWKRLAFLAASCVVPIVANGLRALGIVLAGYLIGDAEAAAADHLIYGWGFFSAVIVLLTLAGLPFRDDFRASVAPVRPPGARLPPPRLAATAALATVLTAAIGPAIAGLLNRDGPAPNLDLPGFAATADCVAAPPHGGMARFDCHGLTLTATVQALPARASPAALRAARSWATGEQDAADAVTSVLTVDGVRPAEWRLVELRDPERLAASTAWIDGDPAMGGFAGRARQAWNSVAGGGKPPVLLTVALASPRQLLPAQEREQAIRLLGDFLRAQAPMFAAIRRATGGR